MRKIVVLAAMLAVLGMASQAADAGNRGVGVRHLSPHVGAKIHDFKLHRPGVFGKRNVFQAGKRSVFKSGKRSAFKVGKRRLFEPRSFSRFGRSGLVLKFSDGALALRFGHVPRFKPHPFEHGGRLFKFGDRRHFKPRHRRGFAFGKPWHFRSGHLGFDDRRRGFEGAPRRTVPGPGSFEAVLKQLEEQGFRQVTRLLRERSHRPRLSKHQAGPQ
jgi:hypothetical protein